MTITPINLIPSNEIYSQIFVTGINNSGQIVGQADKYGSFLWQNGSATSIGSSNFFAAVVNDAGVVAGSDGYIDFGDNFPATILDYDFVAIYQNGSVTRLGALGSATANNIRVSAINNSGEIVGESASDGGGSTAAFLYQNGNIINLGSFPGATITYANGINDAGEVVGYSSIPVTSNTGTGEAYSWQNGLMTRLASLPGSVSDDAQAINDAGIIVGQSHNTAVIWKNGSITSLGFQSGYATSIAKSVNDSGLIVGSETSPYDDSTFPPTFSHAVLWYNGAIIDLNSLLPANSGWVLSEATGINDHDEVIGTGTYNGHAAGFALTIGAGDLSPTLDAATAVHDYSSGTLSLPIMVNDNASAIAGALDSLQAIAVTGRLSSIAFTDPGIATFVISSAQANADAAALAAVTGNFWLIQETDINAGNQTVTGSAGALGNSVVFDNIASLYSVKPAGDGVHFTVSGNGASYQLSDIQALKFIDIDYNEIVAPAPGSNGVVTGGNVTELYGAVFGRIPDVPGLGYYEKELAVNPSLSLVTLAKDFLTSPEYTNAHNYAQSAAGEAQFITDSYHNLLKRAPESGAVPYYQNILASFTQGLTPGAAAYAAAELDAHAVVLVDFSASAEFLNDVQITAAHPASGNFGPWLVLI